MADEIGAVIHGLTTVDMVNDAEQFGDGATTAAVANDAPAVAREAADGTGRWLSDVNATPVRCVGNDWNAVGPAVLIVASLEVGNVMAALSVAKDALSVAMDALSVSKDAPTLSLGSSLEGGVAFCSLAGVICGTDGVAVDLVCVAMNADCGAMV